MQFIPAPAPAIVGAVTLLDHSVSPAPALPRLRFGRLSFRLLRSLRVALPACAFVLGAEPLAANGAAATPPPVIWDAAVDGRKHEPMRRYFRLAFDLPDSAVSSARLRFGGATVGEIHLNGARVGDWAGWGEMPRHEVAALLRPGRNILAISVERGTSRLHTLTHPPRSGRHYALLGRLRIDLADGTALDLDTDAAWQSSATLPPDWPLAARAEGWGPVAVYTLADLWDYAPFRANEEFQDRLFSLPAQPNRWDREQEPRPHGPVARAQRRQVAGVGPGRQFLVDAEGRSVHWLGLGTQVSIGFSASVSPTYEYQHREAEDWYAYLGSWGLNGSLLFVGEPWNDATRGYLAPFLHRWDRMGYSIMVLPIMNRTIFRDGDGPALGKRFIETSYDSDYFFPGSAVRPLYDARLDDVVATVSRHPSVFALSLHDEAFYWPKAGSAVQEQAWTRFISARHASPAAAALAWNLPGLRDWSDIPLARALEAEQGSPLNLDLGRFRDEVVVNHLDHAAKRVKAAAPRLLLTKNYNNWTNWIAKKSAARTPEIDIISLNNFSHRLHEFAGQIRFVRTHDRVFMAPSVRADGISIAWTSLLMGAAGSAPFYDGRWFLYAGREDIEHHLHARNFIDEVDLSDFRRLRPAVAVIHNPAVPLNTDASDFSNPMLELPASRRYVRVTRALDLAGIDHDHVLGEAEASAYAAVVRLDRAEDPAAVAAGLAAHAVVRFPAEEREPPFAFRLLREDRRLGLYQIGARAVLDDGRTGALPPAARASFAESATFPASLAGLAPSTTFRVTLLHPLTGERREFSARTDADGLLPVALPAVARSGFVIVRARAE